MIPPSLAARIRSAFPASLCNALVSALDEAYQEVASSHRPERGWDRFTFGTGVWRIALFHLQELARQGELEEVPEQHRTTFRRKGLHLSCYKVGGSAEEDIYASFPNNQNAAKRLVRNNLQWDLFGEAYADDAPVDLVLAHLGNPERGLEGVYLCVPSAVGTDERICAWAYAQLLWQRDARAEVVPADVELAAEVAIERPLIRLKVPQATHQG